MKRTTIVLIVMLLFSVLSISANQKEKKVFKVVDKYVTAEVSDNAVLLTFTKYDEIDKADLEWDSSYARRNSFFARGDLSDVKLKGYLIYVYDGKIGKTFNRDMKIEYVIKSV